MLNSFRTNKTQKELDDEEFQMHVAFQMVDIDRSGTIDFDELKKAMYSLGQEIPDDILKGLYSLRVLPLLFFRT